MGLSGTHTKPEPDPGPGPKPERNSTDDWRIQQYREMGFAWDDAVTLSKAKDSGGFVIWWYRVKQTLGAGWTHAECLAFWCD